jgi:ATPase family associated with various cellular activities (AAA)
MEAFSSSIRLDLDDPTPDSRRGPELADVGRYGRGLVQRFVVRAREADRPQFSTILADHLGVPTDRLSIAEALWPAYEHVNIQAALDAWLADPARTHRVIGVTGYRHRGPFGMGDLLSPEADPFNTPRPGNVSRVALPVGPDDETRECLRIAVVLVVEGDRRIAILFRGADPDNQQQQAAVEVVTNQEGLGGEVVTALRELSVVHNVYRGQVISFGRDLFGGHGSILRFHSRQPLTQDSLILPEETFDDVRRQVVGVARNRERLRASRQHLKRGLLLYGPPGAGKTHTVRYLIGELTDTTIVELTGDTLPAIREACSIARTLQPSMIVVEDVDLVAEQRDHYAGQTPLLFTLLNEMDGLDEDADVVFMLTTNRADLLEPALASRPGRVDQAVHIDLPDAHARRRLIALYRGDLDLDLTRIDGVIERTAGVTASFLKELLRRAAVGAADRDDDPTGPVVRVTADDLDRGLDDLLDTRHRMTRAVLGFDDGADDG